MSVEMIISEASKRLPTDQAILLYLSVALDGNNASQTLGFLPDHLHQEIEPHLSGLLSIPHNDRSFSVLDEIQTLSHMKKSHGLDEMESSWILHYLKREKPAIVGLILKHLPANKVYQILSTMSPELRSRLPEGRSLERVSDDVVEIVRNKFEESLVTFVPPVDQKKLRFRSIRNFSNEELYAFVQDLGLDLIALAFQSVNERSLIELIKNLDESEAENLFNKFSFYQKSNRADIKAAQLQVLNLSLDFSSGSDLVLEAGVQKLARAMVLEKEDFIVTIQHKIPLKSGYQFRRYIDDYRAKDTPLKYVKKIQGSILKHIIQLSKSGTIGEHWSRLPCPSLEEF